MLLKQFALVAVPFFAVMLVGLRPSRTALRNSVLAFVVPLAAGILPFLVADAGALWRDTIAYGSSTYRIIGYGLSSLFLKAHLTHGRYGSYPFAWLLFLAFRAFRLTLAWITIWLLWNQRRAARLWVGGGGFAVSMFALLFISRVFQTSYLVWPLIGVVAAALLANADDEDRGARADVAGQIDGGKPQPIAPAP